MFCNYCFDTHNKRLLSLFGFSAVRQPATTQLTQMTIRDHLMKAMQSTTHPDLMAYQYAGKSILPVKVISVVILHIVHCAFQY